MRERTKEKYFKIITIKFLIFVDIYFVETYNNIKDEQSSTGEFLPLSGKLYIQESSYH